MHLVKLKLASPFILYIDGQTHACLLFLYLYNNGHYTLSRAAAQYCVDRNGTPVRGLQLSSCDNSIKHHTLLHISSKGASKLLPSYPEYLSFQANSDDDFEGYEAGIDREHHV